MLYPQVMEYYAVTKKKEAALHVLMREDHQERLLGEKKKARSRTMCTECYNLCNIEKTV